MADLDSLKDKYEGKKDGKQSDSVRSLKSLQKELEGKKDSAPVRAVKQAVSGFRSQWSGIDDQGKVGVGKGVPGIYYDTVAIPALAGIVDDKYAPEFAVEADKKAGMIRDAIRKDMGIEAPRGALEHFANAGGTMLGQLPVPGAWLKRVLTPVKEAGIAGKVATSPIEYLSPIVDPKKINYGVGTGFGGTIGTVGEMLEEDPVKKALGGLIQKYEDGGKVGKVKSFFSAVDRAIDTLKQKKGTGEQILKEIEKAPGVKKEELELRKIREKLKDKKSITQDEVRALAAQSPAPNIKPIVLGGGVDPNWQPKLTDKQKELLDIAGIEPIVNPEDPRMLGFLIRETGDIIDQATLRTMTPADFGIDDTRVKELAAAREAGTITPEQLEEIRRLQRDDILLNTKILASEIQNQFLMDQRPAKFEKYTTPGGENYREILLQLERPSPSSSRAALGGDPVELTPDEAAKKIGIFPDEFAEDSTVLFYPSGYYIEKLKSGRYVSVVENRDILSRDLTEVEDFLASGMSSELSETIPTFRGGHFDEPNVLVHARVTDRTGPNGEKVLYVEEIQSDWHQQARKERDRVVASEMSRMMPEIRGQAEEMAIAQGIDITTDSGKRQLTKIREDLTEKARETIGKTIPKDVAYSKPMDMFKGISADDLLWEHGDKMSESQKSWLRDYIERWDLDVDGTPAGQAAQDQLVKEYDNWLNTNTLKGVPDAPFKNTSNEIAVKQILDMAAKEGYDTVAFSPGSEHVKRYGMSQYIDILSGKKDSSGLIELSGVKDDRPVVYKTGIRPAELAEYVGKEKADRILSDLENSDEFMLRGQDLEMTTKEGAGKKKIYDEIIPNYVRKYAQKEFGAEPGEIDIRTGSGKTYQQYLDEIVEDPYRYLDEDEIFEELNERAMDKANVRGYDFRGDDADTIFDQFISREGPFDEIWAEAEKDLYTQKAKELASKDPGEVLKAFSVPVTPQMREKITGEGQKLFAAAPVVGVQTIPGMEEAPQQAAPEPEPEVEEMPMPLQDGGKVGKVKSAAAAVRKVLSPESRKENLAKFLEKSEVKEPVYHAAKADVSKFSPKYRTELSNMGHHFGTAEQANARLQQYDFDSESPNIGKYHLNITKPLEVSHMASFAPDHLAEQMMDMNILDPDKYDSLAEKLNYDSLALGEELVKILKKEGYDGLKYPNEREGQGYSFVPFSPNQVKSGIGNIGAYDVNEADIGKKYGGPVGFQSGGQAMATPRSELEEDPFVQTVLNAARHYQGGKEIEAGQMGFRKGPVTVGMNAANIIDPGTRDAMQAQALFAAYRDRLGNVDVNAAINRPSQAPDGFYQGNVMASMPVGQGRAMAGVSGYKSPQKTDISGYNVGYERKVGPGYASGMVFQPKDRRQDTRYDVQYTIPFQSGGSVGLQDGGRVGKTKAAAEKLLRVLHGSPTRIAPEQGKAIDVTTEPTYAVKRGTDKMMGKSGPPMVNQFDVPAGRILQFEEQYSPEDVALMRRYFNKLPQGQAMRGEDIFDAAQGRDAILEGIAKAGGFAGYERPNTGAVGKGQWFRITEPDELVRKARGGLAQFSKPL
jgi:hypothetical protein